MGQWHLAQYNVAIARASAESPEMADFYAQVPQVNAIAEASPGFVWRLTEDAPASEDGVFVLANLSVWESVEALRDFAYRSAHVGVFRDRSRWFHAPEQAAIVLWWVAAGYRPGFAEGEAKLRQLRTNGPTGDAFDFVHLFPAPAA